MRKTKLSALVVATITCFTACSNNTEEMLGQEIRLTSKITPSRVTLLDYQSTQIVEGQQIGVTITGAQNQHDNVAWIAGSDGALTNGDNPIYWGDTDITITSYHPYNTNYDGNSYTFSVNTDQCNNSGYLNSDLLWVTKTASITDDPISLNFGHVLAKINVTLTSNDIADLSNAKIFICGTNISTEFNPITGELSAATSNIAEIKASITTDKAYTGSAIIVPQTIKKGTKFIKLTHGNKDYHYILPENKIFEPGHSYSYKLILNLTGIDGFGLTEAPKTGA